MVPAELKAAARAKGSSRERLWVAMRALRTFTVWDLVTAAGLERPTIRRYLQGYIAAGYVQRAGEAAPRAEAAHRPTGFKPTRYQLVRDVGVEGPRLDHKGHTLTQANAREQMWRTMKILGEFTARSLAVNASLDDCPVSQATAKRYCGALVQARYLIVVGRGHHGSKLYRFINSRNTGARPPVVRWRKREVYDPNADRAFALGGEHV